ncbi:MAG TPA: phosphatase PAP2 family protein [Phycisphaerae bacterium]|jgi:membrane-associated phospholipid phosphatase
MLLEMPQSEIDNLPQQPAPIRAAPRLRTWLIFWGVIVLCLTALLSFNARLDTYLWCATRWAVGDGEYYKWATFQAEHSADPAPPFFMTSPPPMNSEFFHSTARLWAVFKGLGEAYTTAIAVGLIALFFRRQRLLAGAAVLGAALAGLLGWLIRSVDGRYRPTHHDAANRWELFRGFYNGTDLSFPSGHATLVFATAAALSYVFPRGRIIFVGLAACTAISRVVQEAHFWSDVLFGAALGWTVAWLTMQAGDRFLFKRAEKMLSIPPTDAASATTAMPLSTGPVDTMPGH